MSARWLNLLMGSMDHSQQHVATCLLNIDREIISHRTFQIYTGRFYQMLQSDTRINNNYFGSFILEKTGNGNLPLSCIAEDYALRANNIKSEMGCLSVISFAENTFKKKDLSGCRLNTEHPQYVTHTFKFKHKPFKINLLGPLFLSKKHKTQKPEEYAKCVLIFFKPWLNSPCKLKTHMSWSDSLEAWSFQDRHKSDNRWYLKIIKNEIVPTHPFIENINDMFEGKDRAKRQKDKMIDELNKNKQLDIFEEGSVNKLDNNDFNCKSKSLPQYINQSDIIYLSLKNIRKLKISEHIKMVTYDILEAFRPSMINSDCLIPKEINFGKEMLQIITDSWKNIAIIKNTNIDKNNIDNNSRESSI